MDLTKADLALLMMGLDHLSQDPESYVDRSVTDELYDRLEKEAESRV